MPFLSIAPTISLDHLDINQRCVVEVIEFVLYCIDLRLKFLCSSQNLLACDDRLVDITGAFSIPMSSFRLALHGADTTKPGKLRLQFLKANELLKNRSIRCHELRLELVTSTSRTFPVTTLLNAETWLRAFARRKTRRFLYFIAFASVTFICCSFKL